MKKIKEYIIEGLKKDIEIMKKDMDEDPCYFKIVSELLLFIVFVAFLYIYFYVL